MYIILFYKGVVWPPDAVSDDRYFYTPRYRPSFGADLVAHQLGLRGSAL